MPSTVSWNLQMAVRDGQLDDARKLVNEMVEATKRDEDGTRIYEYFLSADGSACHIYERYADSDAVVVHLGNFGTKFMERFMTCFEPTSFSVYGSPSDEARAILDVFGAAYLGWLGGFSR